MARLVLGFSSGEVGGEVPGAAAAAAGEEALRLGALHAKWKKVMIVGV